MKVLWLHSHFLYPLGATKYIFEVCKLLGKKHDLGIVVEDTSQYWKNRLNSEGIKPIIVTKISSNNPIYWIFFPFILFKEILEIKKISANYDVIISSIFPMNFISIFLSKPTIFLCFEPFSFFYNRELINRLNTPKRIFTKILSLIYSPLDQIGTTKSDILITLNQDRADLMMKIYGKRTDGLSGMAVDGNNFKPIIKNELKNKYSGKKIILHSTDFTVPKGTPYLIDALPLIIKSIPDAYLLIMSTVWDPKEKEKLMKLVKRLKINNHVEFLGSVDEKDLPAYYSLAEITAFVADPENTISRASLMILESLSCKTPVVSSIKHLAGMIEGKTGYVVNPKNSFDLSSKIIKLLGNEKLKNTMGNSGRALVNKEFTWDRVCQRIEEQIHKYLYR